MEKKAEYQITAFENEGIFEIIITGELTESSVENLQDEVTAIINANGVENLLVDVRAIKGYFGYSEVYFSARNYPPEFYRINIAIVDIPENADFQRFQEATSINAGMSFKWFTDIDAARDWFKSIPRKGSGSSRHRRENKKGK